MRDLTRTFGDNPRAVFDELRSVAVSRGYSRRASDSGDVYAHLSAPEMADVELEALFLPPKYLVPNGQGGQMLPTSIWPEAGENQRADAWEFLRDADTQALLAARAVLLPSANALDRRVADLMAYWRGLEEQQTRVLTHVLQPHLDGLRGVFRVFVVEAEPFRNRDATRPLPTVTAEDVSNYSLRNALQRAGDPTSYVDQYDAGQSALFGDALPLVELFLDIRKWWMSCASGLCEASGIQRFAALAGAHGVSDDIAAFQWTGVLYYSERVRETLSFAGLLNVRRSAAERVAMAVLTGRELPEVEQYAEDEELARAERPDMLARLDDLALRLQSPVPAGRTVPRHQHKNGGVILEMIEAAVVYVGAGGDAAMDEVASRYRAATGCTIDRSTLYDIQRRGRNGI